MLKNVFKGIFVFSFFGINFLFSSCSSDSGTANNGGEGKDTIIVTDTVRELITQDTVEAEKDTTTLIEEEELAYFFEKYGVEGSFLLFDPQYNRFYRHNAERAQKPFLPASTFKILNSLIALETGVIADTNTIIPWDGVERGVESWNQNHHMKSAFSASAVWFYQELARRIGVKRMQHYVNSANYGNKNIDGKIDRFWLDGKLRITMEEQIVFLRRLYKNALPFSYANQMKVKGIMEYSKTEQYTIRAKTGWVKSKEGNDIGWIIGWVELPEYKGYYFATNIDISKNEEAQARHNITMEILKRMKIIE